MDATAGAIPVEMMELYQLHLMQKQYMGLKRVSGRKYQELRSPALIHLLGRLHYSVLNGGGNILMWLWFYFTA